MGMLERLKAGTNNSKIVPFLGEKITLRVLSEAELQHCRAAAHQEAERLKLDDEGIMLETVLRQLYMAAADAGSVPLADTFDGFKSLVSRSEREYLVDRYLELENECSPLPEMLTDEEYSRLKDEVKKSPDMFLNPSNIALLKRLAAYLANRLRN